VHLLEHSFRLLYAPALQIGIFQVVHGVKALIAGLAVTGSLFRGGGELRGLQVRADGFVPRTDSRKEMRRHVIGMADAGAIFAYMRAAPRPCSARTGLS